MYLRQMPLEKCIYILDRRVYRPGRGCVRYLFTVLSDCCQLQWTTEIEPDRFAAAIEPAMAAALTGLQQVLSAEC